MKYLENLKDEFSMITVLLVLPQVSEEWWNNVQGVDKPFGSGLLSSIFSLQKSYLSLLEETDSSYKN